MVDSVVLGIDETVGFIGTRDIGNPSLIEHTILINTAELLGKTSGNCNP